MELMVAVAIVAILAAIAVPSYSSYITSSRANNAATDLVALSLDLNAEYSKTLVYPVYSSGTAATTSLFTGWSPTASSYFTYSVVSTTSSYTLTATGIDSMQGCILTLDNNNTRTATDDCGFSSW